MLLGLISEIYEHPTFSPEILTHFSYRYAQIRPRIEPQVLGVPSLRYI